MALLLTINPAVAKRFWLIPSTFRCCMDASFFYMDLLELGIIMHRSRWQTGVTGHMRNGAHIWHLFVKCQKIKLLDYEEVHWKKNKLAQWGSHILTSILTSHMMVTKNPQNVHRNLFLGNFVDLHIWHQNWHQYLWTSLCQFIFFLWTSSKSACLTFWYLTSFWQLHIFSIFWHIN